MNSTNITAQLNEIRRQDLLREAEHQHLVALVADHPAARSFRLVPRWRRRAGSPVVRAA